LRRGFKIKDYLFLDLDLISFTKMIKLLWKIKKSNKVKSYIIYRTNKGYHVQVFFNKTYTDIQLYAFRAMWDDDPYRIRFSLKRYMVDKEGTDVTFALKMNEDGKQVIRYDITQDIRFIMEDIDKDGTNFYEIIKKYKDFFKFETFVKEFVSFPVYLRELDMVIDNAVAIGKFSVKPSYDDNNRADFYIVFPGGMGRGMDLKKMFKTVRNTFYVRKFEFDLFVGNPVGAIK